MTREEFEQALDAHRLWIIEHYRIGGEAREKKYLVRRNGMTRTWKKDKDRWEIPIKWKLNKTARINHNMVLSAWFEASPGPENVDEPWADRGNEVSKQYFDRYIAGDK